MTEEIPFNEKRLVLQHPAIDTVEVREDVVYRSTDNSELLMDIATPAASPAPAIIFVHGGPVPADRPQPKTWRLFRDYGRLAACYGLVGVTFNHRFHAREQLPQSMEDVAAAVAFVRENSAEFHIDPNHICLWVFSGGGYQLLPFLQNQPTFVRCLISFYARHSDAMSSANASNRIPYLIVRAGKDRPGFNDPMDQFVASALSANAPLELINHVNGEHGFDLYESDDSPDLLLQSQRAVKQAMQFAQAHLRNQL